MKLYSSIKFGNQRYAWYRCLVSDGNAQTGHWLLLMGTKGAFTDSNVCVSVQFQPNCCHFSANSHVKNKKRWQEGITHCLKVLLLSRLSSFSLSWLFVWFVLPGPGSPAPPCVIKSACFLFLPCALCLDLACFFFWLVCRWTVLAFVSRQPKDGSLSSDLINLGTSAALPVCLY